MNTAKENSKAAFNQQAATYDKDIKGQARPIPLSCPVGKAVAYSIPICP